MDCGKVQEDITLAVLRMKIKKEKTDMKNKKHRCGECARFGKDRQICWYREVRRTAHNPACEDYKEEG